MQGSTKLSNSMAYEWRRQSGESDGETENMGGARYAKAIELESFIEQLNARLDAVNFFWPEGKRDHMVENLRNLFSRMPLTDTDIRILHGVIRALAEKRWVRK